MSNITNEKKDAPQPLTPAVFHVLLALSAGERLGPGTLYRSLKEMTRARLLAEVPVTPRAGSSTLVIETA